MSSKLMNTRCVLLILPILPTKSLDVMQRAFEVRRGEAAFLFEELANLTTWYELFATAYEELLVEVERRHNEHKRMHEVVIAYQKELSLWYQGTIP